MARVLKFVLSLFVFAVICYVGLGAFVNSEVGKELDQAVADTPGLALTYADLDVDIFEHTVRLENVAMTLPDGQSFQADVVRIIRFDNRSPVPHYAQIEADGMVVHTSFANFGDWAAPLKSMGISEVRGDVAVDFDYNPETRSLSLKGLAIRSESLGDIRMAGVFDELDLTDPRVEKLVGLRISELDLTFTDHSLTDSMLTASARTVGTSTNATRETVCAELAAMAEYAGKAENDVAHNALHGFRRFVGAPGTITLSARPAEPVPWLYFFMGRDVYDNLRLLNVTVSTDSGDNI